MEQLFALFHDPSSPALSVPPPRFMFDGPVTIVICRASWRAAPRVEVYREEADCSDPASIHIAGPLPWPCMTRFASIRVVRCAPAQLLSVPGMNRRTAAIVADPCEQAAMCDSRGCAVATFRPSGRMPSCAVVDPEMLHDLPLLLSAARRRMITACVRDIIVSAAPAVPLPPHLPVSPPFVFGDEDVERATLLLERVQGQGRGTEDERGFRLLSAGTWAFHRTVFKPRFLAHVERAIAPSLPAPSEVEEECAEEWARAERALRPAASPLCALALRLAVVREVEDAVDVDGRVADLFLDVPESLRAERSDNSTAFYALTRALVRCRGLDLSALARDLFLRTFASHCSFLWRVVAERLRLRDGGRRYSMRERVAVVTRAAQVQAALPLPAPFAVRGVPLARVWRRSGRGAEGRDASHPLRPSLRPWARTSAVRFRCPPHLPPTAFVTRDGQGFVLTVLSGAQDAWNAVLRPDARAVPHFWLCQRPTDAARILPCEGPNVAVVARCKLGDLWGFQGTRASALLVHDACEALSAEVVWRLCCDRFPFYTMSAVDVNHRFREHMRDLSRRVAMDRVLSHLRDVCALSFLPPPPLLPPAMTYIPSTAERWAAKALPSGGRSGVGRIEMCLVSSDGWRAAIAPPAYARRGDSPFPLLRPYLSACGVAHSVACHRFSLDAR